jgi:hypothetical protein
MENDHIAYVLDDLFISWSLSIASLKLRTKGGVSILILLNNHTEFLIYHGQDLGPTE